MTQQWVDDVAEAECAVSGSHVISRSGDQPDVVYVDGTFVGHCHHCGQRIVLSFKPGGMDTVRLDELAATVLVNDDYETLVMFKEAYDELAEHHAAITKSLRQASTVRQIIIAKYEAAHGELPTTT